ncbi:MAG: molybdopterin molybdotransferase MoeA [Oscillospiraceae bacterium]|nr:molybdopterin molybdotransferase MoeA [Oscillospiraceae bacterium]
MLQVKTPEEALRLIETEFSPIGGHTETVPLEAALGRVLAQDVCANEYVPDFDRSTVDGYALRAADTFGCSDAIPAILNLVGEVQMGEQTDLALPRGACAYVPTGGAIPAGADCMVMIEYTEDYGDGTIGILKPGAPGLNLIFRGDDVRPGQTVLHAGSVLTPPELGALAAVGQTAVPVRMPLRVAVLSTGDELVPPEQTPGPGQVRDVNAPMLSALLRQYGAEPVFYGIVSDDEAQLRRITAKAASECDAVLLSGGSSAGVKDAACRIIASLGAVLFHGVAIKPGKPTILGKAGNTPIVGLPGHPVAAYFVSKLFVLPLLARLEGRVLKNHPVRAVLTENLGANHGRAQINACTLSERDGALSAAPIRSKSGLITQLAEADGYLLIDRDCEGLPKGAPVDVYWNL